MKAFVETGVFGYQEMLDFLDLYKIDYGHLSKKQFVLDNTSINCTENDVRYHKSCETYNTCNDIHLS